jgi:hypothetical protein
MNDNGNKIYFFKLSDFILDNNDINLDWLDVVITAIIDFSYTCSDDKTNNEYEIAIMCFDLQNDTVVNSNKINTIFGKSKYEYWTNNNVEPEKYRKNVVFNFHDDDIKNGTLRNDKYNDKFNNLISILENLYNENENVDYYIHLTCTKFVENIINKGLLLNPPHRIGNHEDDYDEDEDEDNDHEDDDDPNINEDEYEDEYEYDSDGSMNTSGGKTSKRKTSKRKTNKRKTSKRKTSKRKTSKRKTSKRKTGKRKTNKRKTNKRKTNKLNY